MKYKIEPVGKRILIQPEPESEYMKGGLVVPATAQEKPQIGVIKDIGPDYFDQPVRMAAISGAPVQVRQLEIGQRVLYGKYAGTEITVEGEAFLILQDDDVLAILHDAPAEASSEPDPATGQTAAVEGSNNGQQQGR